MTPDSLRLLIRTKNGFILNGECWDWTGKKNRAPTRKIWEAVRGPIPRRKLVCHTCDRPRCGRPKHLWTGTPRQNTLDAKKKCRLATGELHHMKRPEHRENVRSKLTGIVRSAATRERVRLAALRRWNKASFRRAYRAGRRRIGPLLSLNAKTQWARWRRERGIERPGDLSFLEAV